MRFPSPLERGRLVQRYKRFLADVVMDDGRALTAHVPNPGAMLGLNAPGLTVWLSPSRSPARKLSHTLEMVEADGGLVGVNTMNPNRLVAEALAGNRIAELAGYADVRPEVRYGLNSRIDFLLSGPGRAQCWLEVKNCHFRRDGTLAEFPECTAARSARHLRELEAMVAAGDRAVPDVVVQREDCDASRPRRATSTRPSRKRWRPPRRPGRGAGLRLRDGHGGDRDRAKEDWQR